MKKIFTILSLTAIFTLAALGAVVDGRWSAVGSDRTAPKQLSIRVNGNALSGTMDGVAIGRSGVEGNYFWFYVMHDGANYLYKGQIKAGQIELRESGPQTHRVLRFTRAQ